MGVAYQNLPALVLDRDDTVVIDVGYMSGKDPIRFVPGAIDLARIVAQSGIPVFIATNQSGIARGFYTVAEMHLYNNRLRQALSRESIDIKDVVFCPHGPEDRCLCRKPMPGMLFQIRDRYGIDLKKTIVVGDKKSDEQLGARHCHKGIRISPEGIPVETIRYIYLALEKFKG